MTADKQAGTAGAFMQDVAKRLKKLREDVRKMSPEDVAAKVADLGGSVSASYIRRIEKGQNVPTIEVLDYLLRAMHSSLGLFFEFQLETGEEPDAKRRKYERTIRRSLEGPHKNGAEAILKMLDRLENLEDRPL